MPKKVPIINGKVPDEQYDLDDETHLIKLGLNPAAGLKIADKYVHYQNCKHAVIETKSSTLRKAVEQIESTIEQLLAVRRNVDISIIIANRLNRFEKQIFKRRPRDNILLDLKTGNPRLIRVRSQSWPIILFYSNEVKTMYAGMNKYLSRR